MCKPDRYYRALKRNLHEVRFCLSHLIQPIYDGDDVKAIIEEVKKAGITV
jgi:hypothetical protein